MTKKSLLAALNAASKVKVTLIGGTALDDWTAVKAKLEAEGFTESRGSMCKGTSFVMRPKIERERVGTFSSTSTNYTFSWGDKSSGSKVADLKEVRGALELTMFNGATLRYEVDARAAP